MNLKIDSLKDFLKSKKNLAIALSGGLDSSALLAASVDVLGKKNCLALVVVTPYMMTEEINDAFALAKNLDVECVKIEIKRVPESIIKNPPDRCYKCKFEIFTKIILEAKARGFNIVADGSNADDISDYRPGMRAIKELGVISPLLECQLGKKEIRAIARNHKLDVAEKSAYACLLTRLEHGTQIDCETLNRIDNAENFLRALSFKTVRVRLHGDCARIEIDSENFEKFFTLKEKILEKFESLKFKHIALDIKGYSKGSMNEKS